MNSQVDQMRLLLPLAVLLFGASAASAQSARDFQLPPDPDATPSSRQQAQGPIDTEGETRSVPQVIGTPTPQPSVTLPTPRATATPTPAPTRTAATPRATPTATRRALPASDTPAVTREVLSDRGARTDTDGAVEPQPNSSAADDAANAGAGEQDGSFTLPVPNADSQATATDEAPAQVQEASSWYWIAALIAALLALGAGLFVVMRRRRAADAAQPEVVDMSGPPLREVNEHSYLTKPDAQSLEVEAQAVTLSRSVMNATISYRVSLVNRGRQTITQIALNGDVTTAHGRVPAAQQLADIDQTFPELYALARLEPGQRMTMQGELRLPLREVRALRQGSVPVFVPLLRLTVRAENIDPRAYTFVIGNRGADKNARPNPFRLDEPPRSYAQLTTRAVA